jgi:hypothetical protein
MSTAFDPKYCIGLCQQDHEWAHGQPDEFREWVIGQLGEEVYYDGLRLSNVVVKNQNYSQVRDALKIELARYGKGVTFNDFT